MKVVGSEETRTQEKLDKRKVNNAKRSMEVRTHVWSPESVHPSVADGEVTW